VVAYKEHVFITLLAVGGYDGDVKTVRLGGLEKKN
jgi:hypothetical protein